MLASALAFFLDVPGYKGRTIPAQELRALVTLVIGLAFFLIFSTWPQTESRLQKSLQWLTIGGIIAVVWTVFQAYYIFRQADQYPAWMQFIQEWLVFTSPYFATPGSRVTGFTYEASWFAHQMVMLYIPLWLAATYQRSSAFKFRFLRLSLENILLVVGVGLFFLTSPRIGLISFFLIGVFIFLKINLAILHRLVAFIAQRRWFQNSNAQAPLRLFITLLTSGLLLLDLYHRPGSRDLLRQPARLAHGAAGHPTAHLARDKSISHPAGICPALPGAPFSIHGAHGLLVHRLACLQ